MKSSKFLILLILILCTTMFCSCALMRGPLDKKSGFSHYLTETEINIRQGEWRKASISLKASEKAWKQIKPILQIDIDHDYVNDIENNFVLLSAYIESQEEAHSMAIILVIQNDWKNIGEM